ncbi:MAG: DUF47 family protein [archaeon GB-1867-005]|nr:DUF47 family protein [Candidatus Culexmicrobium cathedralense]
MFKSTYSAFWFGKKREIEILNICRVHLETILSVISATRDLVYAVCDGEYDKACEIFKLVFDREREADDVKERILDELSKGPFHPIDREEIIHLVLTADDLAANAKSAGRKLCLAKPEDMPECVKVQLKKMADMVYDIGCKLKEAFTTLIENPRKAIDVAEAVERLEEAIDEHRVDLLIKILKWGDEAKKISHWLMVKEAVENLEMVADKAEDTADVIRAISIIKA